MTRPDLHDPGERQLRTRRLPAGIVAKPKGCRCGIGELATCSTSQTTRRRPGSWHARGDLAIQRQPATITVAGAQAAWATIAQLALQLPSTLQLRTMYDRSLSINAEVSDVKFTLVLTIALVVLVIFVFLRNGTATLIPSLVLPLAVVGTFAGMYALGFSLDNLSMMALTLAVGFVVDDAVVMLENIVRHLEMGKDRMTAARTALGRWASPLLS